MTKDLRAVTTVNLVNPQCSFTPCRTLAAHNTCAERECAHLRHSPPRREVQIVCHPRQIEH
jgi:hypothetical protein